MFVDLVWFRVKSLEKFFEVTTPKLNIADNLSASYSRDFEAHETLNGMKVNQSSIQGERETRRLLGTIILILPKKDFLAFVPDELLDP